MYWAGWYVWESPVHQVLYPVYQAQSPCVSHIFVSPDGRDVFLVLLYQVQTRLMQEKISGSLSRRLASPGRSYTTKESQKIGHRIYPSRSIVICCIRVYHFRNWPLLSHRAAAVGVVGFELNPANLAVNDVDIEMQNEPSSHNAEDYTAYLSS